MMHWTIIFQHYAIGPFVSREAADEYIATDPEGGGMRIYELYPPAQILGLPEE